jgi:hypothetical protein
MNKVVKSKMRLTVKLLMTNGGTHRRDWAGEAIVIKRSDVEHVHAYAQQHANPRDFLILHIPMKIGLRNSEIRSLRIEHIDFENRSFQVLDSKKYTFFPLPLDMLSLQLVKDLVGERCEGLVFTHRGSWTKVKADEPLSRVEIWQIIHDIAEKVGVKGFNPRILRHYFAAHWVYDEKKSLVTLQRILRHKSLAVTQVYLSKLSFFEDVQREFDGVQNSPLVPETTQLQLNDVSQFNTRNSKQVGWVAGETICNGCSNLALCRSWTQKNSPLPSCASECRFKPEKKEMIEK